jgi:hypothetical protein
VFRSGNLEPILKAFVLLAVLCILALVLMELAFRTPRERLTSGRQ